MASNMADMCQPRSGGMATPHARFERGAQRVVLEVLEPGQPVRQGAHVAAALDVVLAAQRVEAAAVPPNVPGQQRRG